LDHANERPSEKARVKGYGQMRRLIRYRSLGRTVKIDRTAGEEEPSVTRSFGWRDGVDQVAWETAEALSRKWLPEDHSSAEAAILTAKASALLWVIIVHLRLTGASETDAARQCRGFLEAEIDSPGHGIDELAGSRDQDVRDAANEVLAYGNAWARHANPRNVVVMTALMNLPSGGE
jgi:hypothetical protein